jgi:hypothetical protein
MSHQNPTLVSDKKPRGQLKRPELSPSQRRSRTLTRRSSVPWKNGLLSILVAGADNRAAVWWPVIHACNAAQTSLERPTREGSQTAGGAVTWDGSTLPPDPTL